MNNLDFTTKMAIENLKKAIEKIAENYYRRDERDFAYELYYQLRLLQWPEKIEVTAETTKKWFNEADSIFDNKLIRNHFFREYPREDRRFYWRPDILIHEYENRNNQLLALEIKKDHYMMGILRDLTKLAVYCKGRLKYQKGILIIIGTPRTNHREIPEIKKILKEFPEVEIWIVNPLTEIRIINHNTNEI